MPNLTRNKAITLRMTQEEFDFFQKQISKAKPKNQTDFFLAVLRKKPIIVIEDLRPLLQEIKRQGNNLNQIAKALNERNTLADNAIDVLRECWKAFRAVNKFVEEGESNAVIQRRVEQSNFGRLAICTARGASPANGNIIISNYPLTLKTTPRQSNLIN